MTSYPVTVFDFDENGWLNLQENNLHQVLMQEDIKDKPACVVSIVGAFRQGKSFLLNFLIRYLKIKYKLERKVTNSNWLNADTSPITGFSYKSGSRRHTVGILMWSEIFIAKMSDGQEVAVILLDTQGAFDNRSTIDDCGKIFALSTLISSVQIYNLKENIKQNDLMHLEYFSGYGILSKNSSNSDNNPFQNLILLIRDWPYRFEKNFGADGGNALLNEILNNNDQPDEMISMKKNIRDLFEKISCFLLPHPGRHVACSEMFEGNVEDIENDFKQYVQEFASSILAPENLIPKKINANTIKIRDLISYIRNYAEIFKSKEMPKLLSVFEATTLWQMTYVLEESQRIYENGMNVIYDEDYGTENEIYFQMLNDNKKSEALEYFRNKKVICNKTHTCREYEIKLINNIESKYREYKRFFQMKVEAKKPFEMRLYQKQESEITFSNIIKNVIDVAPTVLWGIITITNLYYKIKKNSKKNSDTDTDEDTEDLEN